MKAIGVLLGLFWLLLGNAPLAHAGLERGNFKNELAASINEQIRVSEEWAMLVGSSSNQDRIDLNNHSTSDLNYAGNDTASPNSLNKSDISRNFSRLPRSTVAGLQ